MAILVRLFPAIYRLMGNLLIAVLAFSPGAMTSWIIFMNPWLLYPTPSPSKFDTGINPPARPLQEVKFSVPCQHGVSVSYVISLEKLLASQCYERT